jgi:2-oxoglutarate ferredoxin oxidoreductase subunit beta
VAVATLMKAGFVARGFSGKIDHLAALIREAIAHRGFSLVDVLGPCVSFNKVNTFAWYKERVYEIPASHDPQNHEAALRLAQEFGDRIPLGVIHRNDAPGFAEHFPALKDKPLIDRPVDPKALAAIQDGFR